jgi:hypothetical protein
MGVFMSSKLSVVGALFGLMGVIAIGCEGKKESIACVGDSCEKPKPIQNLVET